MGYLWGVTGLPWGNAGVAVGLTFTGPQVDTRAWAGPSAVAPAQLNWIAVK